MAETRAAGIRSHNLYGQILGEVGTLGPVAFVAVVTPLLWNAYESRKIYRRLGGGESRFSYHVSFATAISVVLLLQMGWGEPNLGRYNWI